MTNHKPEERFHQNDKFEITGGLLSIVDGQTSPLLAANAYFLMDGMREISEGGRGYNRN